MTARALAGAWLLLCLALWAGTWLPGFHREWIAAFWTPGGRHGGALALALRGHLWHAIAAACVLLAGAGLATPLLRWTGLRRDRADAPMRLAVGAALGLPLLGLGLGWPGLLRPGVVLPGLLWLAVRMRGIVRRAAPDLQFRSGSSASRLLPGAVALLLLPSLILALAPEIHYDALEYHLAFPARWRLYGRIVDPGFPPYSRFHLGGESLYALAGLAGGDAVAKLVNWLLLPLVLVLTARGCRRAGAGDAGTAAAVIALAASPLCSLVGGHAMTDLPAVAAVAAAVVLRLTGRGPGTAAAIGLLLGAAGGVKTPAAPLSLVAIACLARPGERVAMLAGWAAPLGPWVARTWLESGTPLGGLYLPDLLPAVGYEPGIRPFAAHLEWAGSWWQRTLALPAFLIREGVASGHEVSPLAAAALAAALLPAGRLAPGTRPLARAGLAMATGWAAGGGGQIRYLLPVLVLLLPVAAAVVVPRTPLLIATGVAGVLGWARTCVFLFSTATPLDVALGSQPVAPYLAARISPPDLYWRVGQALRGDPSLGRAYVAGDLKAYYWPRDPVTDSQYVTPRLARWAIGTRDAIRLRVKLRQVRAGCLVHRNEGSLTLQELAGGYRWTGPALHAVERLIVTSDRVLALERPDLNAYYYVYALRPPRRPVRISTLHWLALPCAEMVFIDADRLLIAGKVAAADPLYRALATRFPESALPWLRLAECARIRRDQPAMRRCDAQAARRLELPFP